MEMINSKSKFEFTMVWNLCGFFRSMTWNFRSDLIKGEIYTNGDLMKQRSRNILDAQKAGEEIQGMACVPHCYAPKKNHLFFSLGCYYIADNGLKCQNNNDPCTSPKYMMCCHILRSVFKLKGLTVHRG